MNAKRRKTDDSTERQKQSSDESKVLVERLADKERELARLEREMSRQEDKRRREAAVEATGVTSSSEILRRIHELGTRVAHLDMRLEAERANDAPASADQRPWLVLAMVALLLVAWFVIEVL